ncbi:hypothetical protein [Tardiphaga sp.]|uniref:hypothetical protein n=1 Tax=Tardiphaga sp. TaxID=1926292 RepID=UPI00263256A9|nr:hypothetical protein [Tardiphaga sp.]MDB5617984.1 hypothetical protein [Tardiphaga sp.]
MKKIILAAAGSALILLSFATAASAAQRHHVRNPAPQQNTGTTADSRESLNQWGFNRGPSYGGGYDGRFEGEAISAPAGR